VVIEADLNPIEQDSNMCKGKAGVLGAFHFHKHAALHRNQSTRTL
jgi:hypothetical protein